jgi:membrane-associated phospholipid phosphatase
MISFFIKTHKDFFLFLHHIALDNPQFNKIIYFIAEKFDTYVLILAFFVLFFFVYQSIEHTSWKRFHFLMKEAIRIVVSVVSAWGFSYIIKNILKAPRPYLRYPNEVTKLFDYGGFDSFPSGHATLFMALGVMIYLHHRRAGIIFIIFAIFISLARVIAGVHFPIDIFIGWLIGGGISYFVYRRLKIT